MIYKSEFLTNEDQKQLPGYLEAVKREAAKKLGIALSKNIPFKVSSKTFGDCEKHSIQVIAYDIDEWKAIIKRLKFNLSRDNFLLVMEIITNRKHIDPPSKTTTP